MLEAYCSCQALKYIKDPALTDVSKLWGSPLFAGPWSWLQRCEPPSAQPRLQGNAIQHSNTSSVLCGHRDCCSLTLPLPSESQHRHRGCLRPSLLLPLPSRPTIILLTCCNCNHWWCNSSPAGGALLAYTGPVYMVLGWIQHPDCISASCTADRQMALDTLTVLPPTCCSCIVKCDQLLALSACLPDWYDTPYLSAQGSAPGRGDVYTVQS